MAVNADAATARAAQIRARIVAHEADIEAHTHLLGRAWRALRDATAELAALENERDLEKEVTG